MALGDGISACLVCQPPPLGEALETNLTVFSSFTIRLRTRNQTGDAYSRLKTMVLSQTSEVLRRPTVSIGRCLIRFIHHIQQNCDAVSQKKETPGIIKIPGVRDSSKNLCEKCYGRANFSLSERPSTKFSLNTARALLKSAIVRPAGSPPPLMAVFANAITSLTDSPSRSPSPLIPCLLHF